MNKKSKIILLITMLSISTMAMSRNNNNRANQLNPNNDAYWQSRGYNERPNDWEEIQSNDEENPPSDFEYHLHSKIYKHVDSNGRIHLSKQPNSWGEQLQPKNSNHPPNLKIYRYVDSNGVIHLTDKPSSR